MRYQEFIDSINESRENKWFECSECHHILPRCLGGNDDPDNLIYLTYEEHFIAHKLLHDENPHNRDLAYAIAIMSKHGELDSKEYASVKKTLAEAWSGENNPMYGIHRYGKDSPHYGKSHSEETKRKLRESALARTPEIIERFAKVNIGRKASEETRKKLSEMKKGKKMPPRVYELICKNCGCKHEAKSPSVKFCSKCKEVLLNA